MWTTRGNGSVAPMAAEWGAMRRPPSVSLRWAVPALTLAALLVLQVGSTVVHVRSAQRHVEREALLRFELELGAARRHLEALGAAPGPSAVDAEVAALARRPGIEAVALVDTTGRFVSVSDPSLKARGVAAVFPGLDASAFGDQATVPRATVRFDPGQAVVTGSSPVVIPQDGPALLAMRYRPASLSSVAWREAGEYALWGLLYAVAVGVLMVAALRRWLGSPLAALQSALARMATGDHRHPVEAPGRGEFADVGRTIEALRMHLAIADAERTRHRDGLARSEALLRSLTESTSDAIFVKDADGRYLVFNRAASEFVGKPAEDVLGKDDRDLFPPHEADSIMAREREIRESGEMRSFDEVVSTTSGATIFHSIKGPIRDPQGTVLGTFGISRDITARRQTESSLAVSEAIHRTLLENLSSGVVVHGADTAIQYSNPAASEMLGLSADQMRGKVAIDPSWHFISEDGRTMALEDYPVNRVIATGQPLRGHVVGVIRPDRADTTWVLCNAYPVRENDGTLRQVVVTFADITEQQQVKNRLRASEQRFRDLIDTTEGIVWEVDARTMQFTFVSSYAERLLGYRADEWYEKDFWVSHLHPEDRDWAVGFCAMSTSRLEAHDFEYRFVAKDGSARWLRDIVAVVAEDGRPRWLRGVMVDVTERKRDMDALRMQSLVLGSIAEGISMVRSSDGVIVYTNERFESMFGYGNGELVGLHVSRLNAPTDLTPEETAEAIIRSLAQTGQWVGEVHNRKKDGTLFWCSASASAFDHPEHGLVWVTVQEDISLRKEAELELARYRDGLEILVAERTEQLASAKEQAEAANRAKSNFLNSISHELRTPLHLILGMTSLAVESATDPMQRRQIEKAHKSGRHLLAIINDILDIAKIDAGSFAIDPSVFSLQSLLDDALGLIEPLATEKGLALSCTVDPSLPDRLFGDGLRIKQVLINYLANAVKFSDRGGIRVAALATPDRADVIRLRLQVADDGCGIEPALQEKLFHDFTQVDDSASRKYGGAGLGLSICRKITELMGGRVGLDSAVGVGSTFWAEIPLRRAD